MTGSGGSALAAQGALATWLAYPTGNAGGTTSGAAGNGSSPAPGAFQADEVIDGGAVVDEGTDIAKGDVQVNWFAVALALAANEGALQKAGGEVDLVAAMENLSKEIADRAAEIGFGEAQKQIIGENPTVDPPVGGEGEKTLGFGESMSLSSASASGSCGQSSGNNYAPIANYDAFHAISPVSPTTVAAPGVLLNDWDPNGTAITAHLVTNATYGTVNLNTNGGFTYTPNGQPAGADGFFYRASDGVLSSCPAYVALMLPNIDVDTDSDNNGTIDGSAAEDAIEMNAPGKVIGLNKDDDNLNGVADSSDTTTGPSGDNDLVRSVYAITINSANLTGFTFQWVTTGPVKIWKNTAKLPMPTTFNYGDPETNLNEFWVEGTETGEGTVELKMFKPAANGGGLAHSDKVKFTVVDFDLDTDSDNNGTINGTLAEDKIEMDAPGKMLRHNRDDDNANGQEDRLDPQPFVNAQGAQMNDDDLVPATITLDSGGVSLAGWTVTLTRSPELRVFKTQSKEFFPSFDFTVGGGANPLPNTVWVEGVATGQGTVNITLKSPTGQASLSDDVLFTSMFIDLIAYRPQTEGPGYGMPFPKTIVPFAQEITPGVGIRVNGDDDDANGTADRSQASTVVGENDLIEVDMIVDPPFPIPGVELVVSRSNNAIRLWNQAEHTSVFFDASSAVVTSIGDQEFWAEWKGAVATANSTLKLQARATNTQATPSQLSDSLKFFPFHSTVIAFGGNGNDPLDPTDGAFQMAVQLYNEGYDVHAYRENPTTPAQNEVVNAVNNRGVTDVGIFGWSQGGGATYVLTTGLNAIGIGTDFTGYIDAIRHTFAAAEDRYPTGSAYHFNYWQSNPNSGLNLNGAATTIGGTANVDLDVTTTAWGTALDHYSISQNATVQTNLKNSLKAHVAK